MISLGHVSAPRCAAVWTAVTGVGAATCRALAADLRVLVSSPARGGADLESWVVGLAAAAVCLAACWASAVTGLVCVQLLRHRAGEQRPDRIAGVPAPVRRLVLRACAEAELLRRHGHKPTVAEVAAYWPRIHAANRALVGPDPDLVRPGVPLVLPAPSSQES